MMPHSPEVNGAAADSIETILRHAAHTSGCRDDAALAEALKAASQSGTRLMDALLDLGVLPDEMVFFSVLSRHLGMPFLAVPELDPAHPAPAQLPARLALRHRVLPHHLEGSALRLLTYDPFDLEARQMAGQTFDQNMPTE